MTTSDDKTGEISSGGSADARSDAEGRRADVIGDVMTIETLQNLARIGDGLIMTFQNPQRLPVAGDGLLVRRNNERRVREYAECYEVRISYQPEIPTEEDEIGAKRGSRLRADPTIPRLTLAAYNEGKHNGTRIDLLDVIEWLAKHCPDLFRVACDEQREREREQKQDEEIDMWNKGDAANLVEEGMDDDQ